MPLAQLNQIMRFTLAALVSMFLSPATPSGASRLLDCTLNEVETMERQNFVAAITTAGYAGNLVGPAVIGFVAKAAGLPIE